MSPELVKSFAVVLIAVLGNVGASLILKWASLPGNRIESYSNLPSLVNLSAIVLALACYGVAFLGYMIALRTIPVGTAYPVITSLSVVCIAIAAVFVFNETATVRSLLGITLILAGVFVLMSSNK
jgi:multidrug transporter EmrE-like cation transporter